MSLTMDNNHSYRAALALNNVAVSLMKQGSFFRAVDVLKDAVQYMHGVILGQAAVGLLGDKKIRRADMELAQAQSLVESTRVETVYFEDNLVPFLYPCSESDSVTMGRLHPAKIENVTSDESPTDDDMGLHMALMLNNFALASYLLATTTRVDMDQAAKLLDNAHCIFNLATMSIADVKAACDNLIDEVRIMAVALLVMGNLAKVHYELGGFAGVSEFVRFQEKYSKIYDAMQQTQMAEWLAHLQASFAAPAA